MTPIDLSKRVPSPCCGYLTLGEAGSYEICELCWWEDDGQNDPHAEEVWGGPNHGISLAEARRNFQQFGVIYVVSTHRCFRYVGTAEFAKLPERQSRRFERQ